MVSPGIADVIAAVTKYIARASGRPTAQVVHADTRPLADTLLQSSFVVTSTNGSNWLSLAPLVPVPPVSLSALAVLTGIALVAPLPSCGNALCEIGERCPAGATSSVCCPADCTIPTVGACCAERWMLLSLLMLPLLLLLLALLRLLPCLQFCCRFRCGCGFGCCTAGRHLGYMTRGWRPPQHTDEVSLSCRLRFQGARSSMASCAAGTVYV